MSSTWRDLADEGQIRTASRRAPRRIGASKASLALPAVVMSVLGGAFVIWFMSGAPLGAGTGGLANAMIRPAVQPPQIAAAPAMADPKAPDPAPAAAMSVLIDAMTAPAPEAAAQDSAMMPLALQPTRMISTPTPMTAVVGEPQQISAPRIMAVAQPERRPNAPVPTPVAPQAPAAQVQTAQAPPPPAPAAAPRSAPAAEAPAAEAAKRNFSVVLASLDTEGEARAKLGQLKQKYGNFLGPRRLNYHRAKQDGAYVWHIRSTGFTEAEAETACERIEKAGGECAAIDQ